MSKLSIAVYGGTFDPVHAGHITLAEAARSQVGIDRVLFVPCFLSPHKIAGSRPADGEDRLAMLEVATRDLKWAEVDDRELRRGGVSYSWQTAAELREVYPEANLFWILGADQWNALPTWRHPERMAELVDFLVFSRNGEVVGPREGYRARFLEGTHPASASEIRRFLAAGVIAPPGWLHPGVEQLVRSRKLYASVRGDHG